MVDLIPVMQTQQVVNTRVQPVVNTVKVVRPGAVDSFLIWKIDQVTKDTEILQFQYIYKVRVVSKKNGGGRFFRDSAAGGV